MVKIYLKDMDVSVYVLGRSTTTDKDRVLRLREASIEVTKSLSVDQVRLIQDAAALRYRYRKGRRRIF